MSNLPAGAENDSSAPFNEDLIQCPVCGEDMRRGSECECGYDDSEPDYDQLFEEKNDR